VNERKKLQRLLTVNSKVEQDFPKAKANQIMGAEVTMVPEEKINYY
jgi:hypothetical protein